MSKGKVIVLLFSLLFLWQEAKASSHILISKNLFERPIVPDELNVDFDFVCSTLQEAHNYILEKLCLPNSDIIKEEVIIYIRQGTYTQGHLSWMATSPEHTVTIKAYPNEKVIFDGRKEDGSLEQLFLELTNRRGRSNLRIEGLIIQNYINGIWLGSTMRDDNGNYFKGVQNSHNVIKDNVFRRIGNKFSKVYQESYSALGINNSFDNVIVNNVFCDNVNDKLNKKKTKTNSLMHSIYIAHYSSRNIIKNNYISNCSGDAIRIRNGCTENVITGNYIMFSGVSGYVTEWYRDPKEYPDTPEEPSHSTILSNNVCSFSYSNGAKGTMQLYENTVKSVKSNQNYIDVGNNYIFQ